MRQQSKLADKGDIIMHKKMKEIFKNLLTKPNEYAIMKVQKGRTNKSNKSSVANLVIMHRREEYEV